MLWGLHPLASSSVKVMLFPPQRNISHWWVTAVWEESSDLGGGEATDLAKALPPSPGPHRNCHSLATPGMGDSGDPALKTSRNGVGQPLGLK